ncbi:hypothetical protein [Sutcliffiella horikoshii]|uniref:hypothetical protein n=1 Tax=Sutcliffiella horikoshii TaxID=79883 RepID=UPI003CF4C00E
MKGIIGIVGMIFGIALGVYVGLWVCFIGGIVGLVTAVQTILAGNDIPGTLIGWSIVKMVFAGLLGYLSAMIVFIPSFKMFVD